MVKKIVAAGTLLALCLVAVGCTASTMSVDIDKKTRAITLTADSTTNAVVNMDFEIGDDGDFAYVFRVNQGVYRMKLSALVNGEATAVYEQDDINSDFAYSGKVEPGTYTLSVLGTDVVGKFKIQAFDPDEISADELIAQLQEAVAAAPAAEEKAA